MTAAPNTMPSKPSKDTKGRYGATILEVYGPDGNYRRTVCAANDGGRWVFETSGDPFEFEKIDVYKAKRKRDRFTPELLAEYLCELDIEAFKEDFYLTDKPNKAIMLTKTGALPLNMEEFTLLEVRKRMGAEVAG